MKPATIRDVARHAEVSVASVSRVLNATGVVHGPTRERILKAIQVLNYVPHTGARSLSTSRADAVGVILPDLFGEFFSELIRGMDVAARAHGLHLIISSSHDDAAEAGSAIRSMRGRVDGMIVLSPHMNAAGLTASLSSRTPVLLMNGDIDAGRASISVDNRTGAMTAVQHLLDLGRRRIAHIAGPAGNVEAEVRRSGYQEALVGSGLEPWIFGGDFSQAAGYRAVREMLQTDVQPDAIFAANDMMAVGALMALQEAGVACPETVAVAGFDDVPIAALVRPALTTLRIDIAGVGRRAMERLVAMIQSEGDPDLSAEIIRPTLVVRGSTTADPQAHSPMPTESPAAGPRFF